MASKLQEYRRMSEEAQRQLTGSLERWQSFLATASRLYEYQYAMRYEGVSKLTARELESLESSGTLEQLLGTPVTAEEIIEIDDGLTPYFFYVQNAYTVWCIPFDGEKARQNKLEDAHE